MKKRNRIKLFKLFNYTNMNQYRKALKINRILMFTSLLWFIPLIVPVPESMKYVFATLGVFQMIITTMWYTNISSKNRYVFGKIRAANQELKSYGISTKHWQVYAVDNFDENDDTFRMELLFYPSITEVGALWRVLRHKKVNLPLTTNDIEGLKKYLNILEQNIKGSDHQVILYASLDSELASALQDAGIDIYPTTTKYINKPSKMEFYSAYSHIKDVKTLYKSISPYFIGWFPMGD